jgi:hypothetical protein
MKLLYKFILIFLAAVALHPCVAKQSEPVVELSSKVTHSFEGFVRDTSAYAMVVDTSVRESVFKETLVPVEKGGFAEYFSRYPENRETNRNKIFYAYSDSISPFIEYRSKTSSFLDVLMLAYANHYPMEISPDDIWLMILDGFRLHVKNNRNALKNRFVAPGTDTVITVLDNSLSFESTHNEWFWTIASLSELLQSKLPKKTGVPLKTKFSTTSPVDNNISRSMVMAVASEYYSFVVRTSCGIPKIKVNGTKEDWVLLKESFNKLALQLNMKWWTKGLNPVLDEFINIFDGKINLEHWKNIYKYYNPKGCGSPSFDGWISRFLPYTKELTNNGEVYVKHSDWNKRIYFHDVPSGITFVDVKWIYYGRTIPLKLYTGFIGIQVDTTKKMLKAARGYALMAYGLLGLKNVTKGAEYIPGKPLRLLETLSFSDSMNVYGEKGLLYSTHDLEEIERFAEESYLDEEYLDKDFHYDRLNLNDDKPNLLINLYRKGELLDRIYYYARPKMEGDGAIRSLRGIGRWNMNAAIKKFFKQRKIPVNGIVDEFSNEKNLPKFNLEIYVDTVILKDGKKVDGKMDDLRIGIMGALRESCGWRLERAIYRHHKYDFNDSIIATISYKDEGRVDSVLMDLKPEISSFQEEIQSILNYAWMPPNVNSGNGSKIAQEIVDKIKIRITLSKDYRMVCKQNGLVASDSVGVFGAWTIGRNYALCNVIDFSKDLATGEIYRYQCEKFDEKYANLKSAQNVRGDIKVRYDKNKYGDRERTFKKLSDLFVSIKIPPCFVEE